MRAEEARMFYDKARDDYINSIDISIFLEDIEKAAKAGKYCIYVDHLTHDQILALKKLGYKIFKVRNGKFFSFKRIYQIRWDLIGYYIGLSEL